MTLNILIPFTRKFDIFDSIFFNVVAVIKASRVGQIHKQTHFHLENDKQGQGVSGAFQCQYITQLANYF